MGEADNWIITEEGGDDIELGGLLDELAWEFVAEHHRRQDLIRFRINGTNRMYIMASHGFAKMRRRIRQTGIVIFFRYLSLHWMATLS